MTHNIVYTYSCVPATWRHCTNLRVPGVAAHVREIAEPPVDGEGAYDGDYHKDEDDTPFVEDVFETATVYLVHAQEKSEVGRQTFTRLDGEDWASGIIYVLTSDSLEKLSSPSHEL